MSSTTVSVPKYRRHKGSGQAFVQIKGKRHYLGKWDSPTSKERYSAFVAELAANSPLNKSDLVFSRGQGEHHGLRWPHLSRPRITNS